MKSEQAPAGVELHDPDGRGARRTRGRARRSSSAGREIHAQLPTILDHAAVALRHPRRRAAFRLAAASVAGFRATLDAAEFVEVHTPKVVAAATESGANVFPVDWFGRPAFLAQSPQFYKQMMVGVFERVYEVGPVFRAEPHDTVRHLAEYVSLDAELGFINDHHDVMHVLRDVLGGHGGRDQRASGPGDRRARTRAARRSRRDPGGRLHRRADDDRTRRPARRSSASPTSRPRTSDGWGSGRAREHGSDFLFVSGYPMAKRPFYTQPDPERPGVLEQLRPALPRAWSSSPGVSACTATPTISTRSRARTSRPTRDTSRRSATGCRHTAGSRSASSAGLHASPAPRTSARPRLFPRDRNRLTP